MVRPLKRGTVANRQPIITLDIETEGFSGNFIYAAAADERDGTVVFLSTVQETVTFLFSKQCRGVTVWSHNGQFDWRYLLDEIRARAPESIRPTVQGENRIIGLTIRTKDKQCIKLKDSYALIPVSLKKLTETFAPSYAKGYIDFENETFDPSNENHRDYLRRDVQGLLYGLVAFDALLFDTFGIHLHSTAASTALAAFQQTIPEETVYWRLNQHAERFCRQAYYGGRVYLRDVLPHDDVITLDVNAMYASAMRQGCPYGSCRYTTKQSYRPGIFRVRCHCPAEVTIPLLPVRGKDGLIWFYGATETVATTIEIEKARELGYEIEVVEGYEWEGLIYPFNNFVNNCEKIELPYKGTPIAEVCKLMRNSLYGKFGTKEEHQTYVVSVTQPEGYLPCFDDGTGSGVLIDDLWSRTERTDETYIHPEWAAWITANARLALYALCETIGPENVLYTDTDSITASRSVVTASGIHTSVEYGGVKLDKEWATFQALAPKVYHGQLTNDKTYEASKGIPAKLRQQAFNGEQVRWESPTSMMSMLKGEQRFATWRKRNLTDITNSRGVEVHGSRVIARTLSASSLQSLPRGPGAPALDNKPA